MPVFAAFLFLSINLYAGIRPGRSIFAGPVISAMGSLAGVTGTYGTASPSENFSISGANMTAGILVTPPAGFEVSKDNTTFAGTVTIGAAGTIVSTIV